MAEEKSDQKEAVMRREEVLRTSREHIVAAASLLRPLSSEFERVSWILEDTLMYIDEAEAAYEEENSVTASPHAKSNHADETDSKDGKQVNAGS